MDAEVPAYMLEGTLLIETVSRARPTTTTGCRGIVFGRCHHRMFAH